MPYEGGKIENKASVVEHNITIPPSDIMHLERSDDEEEEDSDYLNLGEIEVPELPKNVLFPEEFNRYLRGQVQVLTSENGQLRRVLKEREQELRSAEKNLLAEQKRSQQSPLSGLGRASELAASKIVELSKRVRELCAEVEVQRTRCRSAEARLALLQEKEMESSKTQVSSPGDGDKTEETAKSLTEKISVLNVKLCDSRNQNQALRQELKLAQKALASEVGESVSVQNMSNWRGRAQQILSLQQKVAELRDQLADKPSSMNLIEDRNVLSMRRIEKDRRQAHEQTSKELKETQSQLEETNRKLDGARARSKVLETEIQSLKNRLSSLLEKAKHDDQLVTLLSSQLSTSECLAKKREQEMSQETEKCNNDRRRLEQDFTREKSKVCQLQGSLNEKMIIIDRLTQQVQALPVQHGQLSPLTQPSSRDSEISHQPSSPATEARPTSETDSVKSSGEYQVLSLAAEAERVRLMELLAVMNRRVDEERHQALQAEEALRRERHKTAKMETKVARLELEKITANKTGNYKNNRRTLDKDLALPDDLRFKVELLEEETKTLRTRLHRVEQEKQDDLRTYTGLLEQARATFLRALRSHNSSKKTKT